MFYTVCMCLCVIFNLMTMVVNQIKIIIVQLHQFFSIKRQHVSMEKLIDMLTGSRHLTLLPTRIAIRNQLSVGE